MSSINTNGINVNYPVPGVNNSSQGFRDNFASIKNNLNTAADELTDLQTKVVVKNALTGSTVNNDMANTLISNASVRGFRYTTYNLGNALSGTVVVDARLGDVQYGTIVGNTTLQFAGWSPSGTQSNIQLSLNVGNAEAYISLPEEVTLSNGYGIESVENFKIIGNVATISAPYNVTQMQFRLSTLDCGNNITIEPYNLPRQTGQIQQRTPSPIGAPGDNQGAICIDNTSNDVVATCTNTDATTDFITCDTTSGLYLDMPVTFVGTSFGGITAGTTYYVRTIVSSTQFTISTQPGTVNGPNTIVSLMTASGNLQLVPMTYLYLASGDFDGNIVTKYALSSTQVSTVTNVLSSNSANDTFTVSSVSSLSVGNPVIFTSTPYTAYALQTYSSANVVNVSSTTGMTVGGRITFSGSTFGGITTGTTYYITNVYTGNSNITISTTFNGANLALSSASGNANVTYGDVLGGISANTLYYIKSIVGSTISISTQQGGTTVALLDENGSMTLTSTTDYIVTLNSTSSLNVNDPIIFNGTSFGGLNTDDVYYIASISSPNITLSTTRYNGIAGQKVAISNGTGNLIANVYQGTPIWRRTTFTGW